MRNPRALTNNEFTTIYTSAIKSTSPTSISVLSCLFLGLRCGEVSQITAGDIRYSLENGIFSIRKEIAKYNKSRSVPISNTLALAFLRWSTNNPSHRGRLWSCSLRTVQRRFSDFFRSCNISCTPHDLRHTFACALYSATKDLSLVQALLGHRSLSSTLVYVHIDGYIQDIIDSAFQNYLDLPVRKKYANKLSKK